MKLYELLEKQFLTYEELEEIELDEEVFEVINNGNSGLYLGYNWFTVVLQFGDIDVYVK